MTAEKWTPVVGFEGLYEVSDAGRVRSVRKAEPRHLRTYLRQRGYPYVVLHRDGERYDIALHRVVMTSFVGPRPVGLEIRHLDGDPMNAALSNLTYGTHLQNMADAMEHGTTGLGITREVCVKNLHPLSGDNVYYRRDGRRQCRACRRAADRANAKRYRASRREVAA